MDRLRDRRCLGDDLPVIAAVVAPGNDAVGIRGEQSHASGRLLETERLDTPVEAVAG
jgi:hypothetical protein